MTVPRRRRWDTDPRGRGVGDATAFASAIEELAVLARTGDWVAEAPEEHLLPHIRAAIAARPGLSLVESRTEDGVLVLDVEARPEDEGAGANRQSARTLAVELVGPIAESATFIRVRHDGDVSSVEVVTGTLDGEGPFATHGHTLRLRLLRPPDATAGPR